MKTKIRFVAVVISLAAALAVGPAPATAHGDLGYRVRTLERIASITCRKLHLNMGPTRDGHYTPCERLEKSGA